MKFNVDVVRIRENSIQLNGWAIGKTPEAAISYDVEDEIISIWSTSMWPPEETTSARFTLEA